MKKYLFSSLFILVGLFIANPGHVFAYTWVPGGSMGGWQSISASFDGTRLAAANYGSTMYTSADGGSTWVPQLGSGIRNWYSVVSSSDGMRVAAVDQGGYIYTSTDGGVTWTAQIGSGMRHWYSIASSNDGLKLAAIENTATGFNIYTSTDGGVTWAPHAIPGTHNWLDITSSADGMKLAAVDGTNSIYTSTTGGLTWTPHIVPGTHFYTVASGASGMNLIAGDDTPGYLYKSNNGGMTWVPLTGAGIHYWYSALAIGAEGMILAAGDYGGYIYTSSDSGSTWVTETGAGMHNWMGLAAYNDGKGLAAAAYAGALYTSAYARPAPSSGNNSSVANSSSVAVGVSSENLSARNSEGLTLTPSSGAVNSSVSLNWNGLSNAQGSVVLSIENDNGGRGGQIRQFSVPAKNPIAFCFPATLKNLSESGTSDASVIPGIYNVSVSTSTVKSGIAKFTVTSGQRGDCGLVVSDYVPPVRPNQTTYDATTTVAITTYLAPGRSNSEVSSLQRYLKQQGFLNAEPTGYFGPMTVKAVKLFQQERNLPLTGTVGPLTRAALASPSSASVR